MPFNYAPRAIEATDYPAVDDPFEASSSNSGYMFGSGSGDDECPCGAAAVIRALRERIKELEALLEVSRGRNKDKKAQIKALKENLKKTKYERWTAPSAYTSPMKITFPDPDHIGKGTLHRRELPEYFYRTLHEHSATLTCYTINACWNKTRDRPSVLRKCNAFQSLGDFRFNEHMNKKMVVRHLNWNQKRPSTVYISTYDDWKMATDRAAYHYNDSPVVSRRVSIAKITTAGLVPAFFETYHQDKLVKAPIWIRGRIVPKDRSPIKINDSDELMNFGTEIWLSYKDNWDQGMHLLPEGHRGQFEEWLALGRILKSNVVSVFPYDGTKVHLDGEDGVVTKEKVESGADKDWGYDWEDFIWRSQDDMRAIQEALEKKKNKKRKTLYGDSEVPETLKRPKFAYSR